MALLEPLLAKLQRHPKRVVFPEGTDPRIIQTARQFVTRKCGVPILLGDRQVIKSRATRLDIRLDGIRVLEPERSDDLEIFLPMLDSIPRFSELSSEEKEKIVLDRHNFAALMLTSGQADALVGGATIAAASGLRSIFRIVPLQCGVRSASSMLVLDMENSPLGVNGALFLADCGVIPEPSAEQLADIAISTARISYHLTNIPPRIAFLSFATQSEKPAHNSILKIREAINIAKEKATKEPVAFEIDGEMQLDAALNAETAEHKGLGSSPVAGKATVLIFPDLNSGNIASKMIQIVAGARTYGQIINGMSRPCAEISRGAHAYDVFGTAVITACQAIDRKFLFGSE